MPFSYNYITFWAVALLLGWGCGYLAQSAFTSPVKSNAAVNENTENLEHRSHNGRPSHHSSSEQYLWRDRYVSRKTITQREAEAYEQTVSQLHRESRSPLRATSLLSRRIRNSTFEEWEFLIGEGKVKRLELLEELGPHLARIDPSRALKIALVGPRKFDNVQQLVTFGNSVIRTICDTDPGLVLNSLRKMKRGGAQLSYSSYFSEYWAEKDPRAAADHFDELVWLRNMPMRGTLVMTDEIFATAIMKSWVSKDVDKAAAYVEGLSAGSKRDALRTAFNKLRQNP